MALRHRYESSNHRKTKRRKDGLFGNLKPALIILALPILVGIVTIGFMFSSQFTETLGRVGTERLITQNWEAAAKAFEERMPEYERKFAYYKLHEGQTLQSVATFYSVNPSKLASMNPGLVVAGTTIKLPPLENHLDPISAPNDQWSTVQVQDDHGLLRVRQEFRYPVLNTNIPDLMNHLKQYNVIEQTGPKTYRINRGISLERNIRLDVTGETVQKLELRSSPNDITCLCFDQSAALFKDTEVVSVDPNTNLPDANALDQRSFLRSKNGRMDLVHTKTSYLGNPLFRVEQMTPQTFVGQKEGGAYGVSWRITDGTLGQNLTTGWVEGSTFDHNHYGTYTFGASGMMWRNNVFQYNEIYGLDPHDDSNNAMIENNTFKNNGKHGFIVSKRCNYNIIRNNVSFGNKLHGYMLHIDSQYNVIENNVAYDNADNYVVYQSEFNTIRNNVSYNPKVSHVRINEKSRNNYVLNNRFYGGKRGVFVYGQSVNTYISGNNIQGTRDVLTTSGAHNVLFADNTIDHVSYDVLPADRLVFGYNTVKQSETSPASPQQVIGKNIGANIQ